MKQLSLKTPAFQYLEISFKEWLNTLGYAEQTVYGLPIHVREFLCYMEQHGKTTVQEIDAAAIRSYYHDHLKMRTNMRQSGALSSAHLNKHLQALYKFCDYLRQSGRLMVNSLNIRWESWDHESPVVLTEHEVKQLYEACDLYPADRKQKPAWFFPALALRDKAMLAIYYGCGLRRNEGFHLDLSDVYLDKQLLHVRKGKNYKERFVPISKAGVRHLEYYLYDARPYLLKAAKEKHFWLMSAGSGCRVRQR